MEMVRERDFIFTMHIPLMKPFQMPLRSMTCEFDCDLCTIKIAILDMHAAGSYHFILNLIFSEIKFRYDKCEVSK